MVPGGYESIVAGKHFNKPQAWQPEQEAERSYQQQRGMKQEAVAWGC